MRRLDLYPEAAAGSALNAEEPLPRDRTCKRCELHEGVNTVCMPADDGRPKDQTTGGILLVSEYPGRDEDSMGRPMVGLSGKSLRALLAKWGVSDRVVITNAIACAPGRRDVKPRHVKACRPYAARVAELVQPERIVCLGGTALEGVLGRRPAVLSIRKGFAWHRTNAGLVPIFFTMNPAAAARNRFMRAAFEEDLKWALTCPPPTPRLDSYALLVETVEDAVLVVNKLRETEWASYDVETHGQMHDRDFRNECISFGPARKKVVYTFTRDALQNLKIREVVTNIIEANKFVTANGKYDDRAVLLDFGAVALESEADVRLMSRMLDPAAAAKLDVIAERVGLGGHKKQMKEETTRVVKELKRQANPPSALTPKGNPRKQKPAAFYIPTEVLSKIKNGANPKSYMFGYTDADTTYIYNARDADVTRRYARKVMPEFQKEPSIQRVWDLVVRDANRAVRWIEYWGIQADRDAIGAFATYCMMKIDDARRGLEQYGKFNPNSTPQVADLLFNKLKLPRIKLTDAGADSTDKDVLEALKDRHPLVASLIDHRKWCKLDSTYATGMLPHVREDGRIHGSILLDGAGTGRTSMQEPNLQNIPRAKGSPDAMMARNCFVAPKGYVLLESDFSQLELRIAAMLSNDRVMIEDFKRGIDMHMNNATELCELAWGIPRAKWDKMTKDERDPYRSQVKSIAVFGKLYGKTDRTMAEELGCSQAQIQLINRKIWGRYKRLDAWTKERIAEGIRTGEMWTYWNGKKARRRPLWGVADPDDGVRINAINGLVNGPVQGTASDYCVASLWPICNWILEECMPAKLVATVHDSIIVEVHEKALAEVATKVKEIMMGHYSGDVPLAVDQKIGRSWGSLEDYKP